MPGTVSMIRPKREPGRIFPEQCEDVLERSGSVNAELVSLGINCMQTRALVETGHRQIALIHAQGRTDDAGTARSALSAFNTTLKNLRDAYRIIIIHEDLPGATAQRVLSMAQVLEVMVAQVNAI
ncbi:MAG: hypothetical protein WCX22_10030 [Methanoregula sp.]